MANTEVELMTPEFADRTSSPIPQRTGQQICDAGEFVPPGLKAKLWQTCKVELDHNDPPQDFANRQTTLQSDYFTSHTVPKPCPKCKSTVSFRSKQGKGPARHRVMR